MNETLRKKFQNIMDNVQKHSSCHKKYRKSLMNVYKLTPLEDFIKIFLEFLLIVVEQVTNNSPYVQRSLTFCSQFCGEITRLEEKNEDCHPFLTGIMGTVLKWSCAPIYELRYNSCGFLTMILQDIGEEVQLEVDLIEEIQEVLLERSKEPKVQLQYQAMSALVRLQDPINFECPVIKAYLRALSSGNTNIRRQAVTHIAPNNVTVSHIKDRVRDVDAGVRCVAFQRCADIGPLVFKIADKHMILICGFKETNEKVKNTFYDYLLPKWLTAYAGNFLKFINALKLIADDEDVSKMEYLSTELIKYFYNNYPINDLISALPINDEKVIKEEDLSSEAVLFWKILTGLLRQSDDMEEYLNVILPELTPFCYYIENLIKTKSQEKMDEWKYFEFQFDLFNLLEIAEKYDFSDEVGRRMTLSLTSNILRKYNFITKVTKKIVFIAHKCSSSIEIFTNDMCQIISEIREPIVEKPLSERDQLQKNFEIAELKFKITLLVDQQNEATKVRDYQKAHLLENELKSFRTQLEEKINSVSETEGVRVVKSDNVTLCRCLDILISMMELPEVNKLTPSLMTCKDNLLIPLIISQGAELHWRVLKCLTLFSIIDKTVADEYAKIICIPMATYRTIPNNNVQALIQSICGVVDLISMYGIDIICSSEEITHTNTVNQSVTRRKLYNNDNDENTSNSKDQCKVTLSDIFEIFLEMLDDERDEVRHKAVFALGVLKKQDFPVTASMISRLILKWANPLTEKQDPRLQFGLGLLIEMYMQSKNSFKIIKEAIIPTLSTIVNAPKTSPLSDIDCDNLLGFFGVLMNINLNKDDIRILVLDVCMKMSENLNSRLIILLAKFLNYLNVCVTNVEYVGELIDRVEMLLESIKDKVAKKHIEKFLWKLRQGRVPIENSTTRTEGTNEGTIRQSRSNEVEEISETTVSKERTFNNKENENKESQQIKRKKHRNGLDCVVVLERFDEKSKNETTLHTIIETSMEMQIDEDLTIQTPTSESSNSTKRHQNKTVISETSDSDFSNDNGTVNRRSNRLRKKRIL